MFIFKTSKETLNSVIENKKHAFVNEPSEWYKGEIALICKVRKDCDKWEKQIKHILIIDAVRAAGKEELNSLWPDNKHKWNFIVDGSEVIRLPKPFNLNEILGKDVPPAFQNANSCIKLGPYEEVLILKYLISIKAITEIFAKQIILMG